MSKVVLLFLIGIAVLGIFGKLRLVNIFKWKKAGGKRALKCQFCDRYLFKDIDCNCKNKGAP